MYRCQVCQPSATRRLATGTGPGVAYPGSRQQCAYACKRERACAGACACSRACPPRCGGEAVPSQSQLARLLPDGSRGGHSHERVLAPRRHREERLRHTAWRCRGSVCGGCEAQLAPPTAEACLAERGQVAKCLTCGGRGRMTCGYMHGYAGCTRFESRARVTHRAHAPLPCARNGLGCRGRGGVAFLVRTPPAKGRRSRPRRAQCGLLTAGTAPAPVRSEVHLAPTRSKW